MANFLAAVSIRRVGWVWWGSLDHIIGTKTDHKLQNVPDVSQGTLGPWGLGGISSGFAGVSCGHGLDTNLELVAVVVEAEKTVGTALVILCF